MKLRFPYFSLPVTPLATFVHSLGGSSESSLLDCHVSLFSQLVSARPTVLFVLRILLRARR